MKSIYNLEFLTPAQIAEALQVETATINKLIRAGKIQAVKVGNRNRVSQENFKKFLGGQNGRSNT